MSQKLKWMLILGGILVVGAVALVIGFHLAGADILGWFSSTPAFITYFFVGVYLFVLAWVLVADYVAKR